MTVAIGIISALIGLIYALNKLQDSGVDLNAFSPFTYLRRRNWEKKLGTKPMHGLTDTMEAASLLVVAVARGDGEITRDTKMDILKLFEEEYGVSRKRAIELYSSSSYMINGEMNLAGEVKNILAPTKATFDDEKTQIVLRMLDAVAKAEESVSTEQQAIIDAVKKELRVFEEKPTKWDS